MENFYSWTQASAWSGLPLHQETKRLIAHLENADYERAASSLKQIWSFSGDSPEFLGLYRTVRDVLYTRELEITGHGIQRTFRFWSADEKIAYIADANRIISLIREFVTPHVCLGYGTALAIVRSNDLIPHDDDIDILVGLPIERFSGFAMARRWLAETLRSHDSGNAFVDVQEEPTVPSLLHVRTDRFKTDVFVGIEEGPCFSSFPGPRRRIRVDELFPAATGNILGMDVPIPADAEAYLSKVYGADWRTPIANWRHDWDSVDAFADLCG